MADDDMDVEQPILATELFAGAADLNEEQRAVLVRNMERLLARSTLNATAMTLDSDVVLVAEAASGGEAHVRASGEVLAKVSSGFRGWLHECEERTIRLPQPGAPQHLHPEAAVRFVLAVAHAVAAHDKEPDDGLEIPESQTPPLRILLHVCQIADCWDVLTVLPAAARCVAHAAREAMATDKRAATGTLLHMLRLATASAESAMSNLREPVEAAIAAHVPLQWLPYAMRRLDLESACRIINRIGDSEVVLQPLVLKGGSTLEPPWHAEGKEHFRGSTTARSPRPRPTKRVEVRPSAVHAFELHVDLKDFDEEAVKKLEESYTSMQGLPPETLAMLQEQIQELQGGPDILENMRMHIEEARGKRVTGYVHNQGCPVLVAQGSFIRFTPDGRSKMAEGRTQRTALIEKPLGAKEPRLIASGKSLGYDTICAATTLGGCTVEGTIRVSRLQNQFEVLARWQGCTGRAKICSPSPVVGALKRLQLDAGYLTPRVKLLFRRQGYVKLRTPLYVEQADSVASPAAAELCQSMVEYVALRLDDSNGPVNRATCLLDEHTMIGLLKRPQFDPVFGPASEKALLRMAVDWAWQPGRTPRAINAVAQQIYWAGIPTKTLMHMDEGSGWDHSCMAHNHTLRDRLHELTLPNERAGRSLVGFALPGATEEEERVKIPDLIAAALDAQRAGTHLEEGSGRLRTCFKDDEGEQPAFPSGLELHAMGQQLVADRNRQEAKVKRLQVQVDTLKLALAELELERAPTIVAAEAAADPMDTRDTSKVMSGTPAAEPRKRARGGDHESQEQDVANSMSEAEA